MKADIHPKTRWVIFQDTVNGARFKLLLGYADWARCLDDEKARYMAVQERANIQIGN